MQTKNEKRNAAQKRQETYNNLTVQQKIERLDKRFGKGQGAKKERERLETQL